jgi:hypothetical protein
VPALRSKLRSIREKLANRLLPTGVTFGPNRNDRIGALHRAWGYVVTNRIRGGYYEFGVYRGDTFRAAYHIYQGYALWVQTQLKSDEGWRRDVANDYSDFKHHFYAFDTFEGMPENQEKNVSFVQGSFYCSLDEFVRLNEAEGIKVSDQVQYLQGTFDEVKSQKASDLDRMQPAAIVNLDCDLYVSAVSALSIIKPKLVQGTVLLADDWNTFSADRTNGERKALAEFLEREPHISLEPWFTYMYTGQAFLVHVDEK